jgi:hypothetical protein
MPSSNQDASFVTIREFMLWEAKATSSGMATLLLLPQQGHACRSTDWRPRGARAARCLVPGGTCLSQVSRNFVFHVTPCYTYLRVRLRRLEWSAVSNQNITLSLPEEDLREARILAASRGTSVSQLLARMLREVVEQETGYARARDRSLARLREETDLGTGGLITWSRDSVHER